VEKYGVARQATDDNIIRRMRFTCWMTKATKTHSEYVILIAFPRQQWLRERVSILRYTHIASLIGIPFSEMHPQLVNCLLDGTVPCYNPLGYIQFCP
jgi:hypothetical protein